MYSYYLDPRVTSVGRLPMRARTFESAERIDLNGIWRVKMHDAPEVCPDEVFSGCEPVGFRDVSVPGNFELQGFKKPIYTNYVYPWSLDKYGVDGRADPWRVPDENPTACCRRTFTLDEIKPGCKYILRFEGVETAYDLFINGKFAGYAEDSKLPSEFDVTDLLKTGENLIALKIYTYATSSYLEDQDYWYLTGIYRPVTLICVPALCIEDYRIKAVPDRHLPGGVLTADVTVSRRPGYADRSVRVRLVKPDGTPAAEGVSRVSADCGYSAEFAPTANTARVTLTLPEVTRWCPEQPYLYRAEIELLGPDGTVADRESCPVGFKRVDIEGGILLINGKRALIFGVNRHEFAWKQGRAVTKEHMLREIAEMKRMNINAVRTCHYPDSDLWYSLCDEQGILVLCECDLETHGVSGAISHDASFAPQYVERAQRMVARHANHPCIYGWSLGNESGFGPGHAAMYGLVKQYDDTRLCQYEAGNPGADISDVRGRMYATEQEILDMLTDPADDRPVILVEYLYQIRSAGGGMQKFIDFTQRYPRFQGGFIWDWQDKALPGRTADGRGFFAHGGDFGESFTDPEVPLYMTNNGIVRADLVWKPVAYDVREAYAPILIDAYRSFNAWAASDTARRFTVTNRSSIRTLAEYEIRLTLSDGESAPVPAKLPVLPDLKPGESHIFELNEKARPGKRLFAEFTVLYKGEAVAHRQFPLCGALPEAPEVPCGPVTAEKSPELSLSSGALRAVFDENGMLSSLTRGGKALILASAVSFDRPYCGLDAEKGWGWREVTDAARAPELRFAPARLSVSDDSAEVTASFTADAVRGTIRWTMSGPGALAAEMSVQTADGFCPPRIGLRLTLPSGFRNVAYTGYGPHETYSDRLVSAVFASYETTVDGLGFDYAPPSENGGREGVTRLMLSDGTDRLTVDGIKPFHFDARGCGTEALKRAQHTHEIVRDDAVTVHLDAYHMPIGGDMAWSTMLAPEDIPHAAVHTLNAVIR